MGEPVAFVITFVFGAIAALFLIRFILQACRADFYNPISQGLVRFTDPVLKPIRTVIPTYKNLDFSAFVVTWLVNVVAKAAEIAARGGGIDIIKALVRGLYGTFDLFLTIYFIAIFAMIILSFVAPGTYNPVTTLLHQVTEPVLAPARRLLPPIGGVLDLSPLLVFLLLTLIQRFMLPSLFYTLFPSIAPF